MTDLSYLIIYNAHTGTSSRIPKPIRYHSLGDFKRFLQTQLHVDSIDNLFLLTSFGIKLNFGLINELNEVYVFDKRLFGNSYDPEVLSQYTAESFEVVKPTPSTALASTETQIRIISSSLKSNQGWARAIVQDCHHTEELAKELVRNINAIFKSLNTIFQFATNFINEIEKNFNSYLNYIKLINYKTLHRTWIDSYNILKQYPPFKIKDASVFLVDFLNHDKLLEAANYVSSNLPLVVSKFNGMSETINSVGEEKLTVDKEIESLRNGSINEFKDVNLSELMAKIYSLSRSITNDLEQVSNNDSIKLDEVYKEHKENYSPLLYDNAVELHNYFLGLRKFKEKLTKQSVSIFNSIANLQMKMVSIKSNLKTLTTPSESTDPISFETINTIKKYEDYLSLNIDLPLLFGFVLIEKRRQFEWYDFYSKGIVNNVSEQLSTIIDHEKLFRKIWLRKFGNFLTLLSDETPTTSLPNIDVTLVGIKEETFKILHDIQVERSDIVNYIAFVESSKASKNFVELLNKNFRDLIRSTNNMKKITRVISSLGTYTSLSGEEKSKILSKEDEEGEIDFDLNLIKGLKTRIKKLESLLHQQQYKNLTSWPVTRNNVAPSSSDNRLSLIIEPQKKTVTPPKSDPKQLLQKQSVPTRTSSAQSAVLDSTNIDIRLELIKIKKENTELINENSALHQSNDESQKLIKDLRKEIEELKAINASHRQEADAKLLMKEEEFRLFKLDNKVDTKLVENLEKKVEQRDAQVSKLKEDLSRVTEINTTSDKEIIALNSTISSMRNELNDTVVMKNDLLSNISAKEVEHSKERNGLENEIKALSAKVDELTEDYENLMEITQSRQKNADLLVNDLNNIIIKLMNDMKRLAENIFEYFLEFCFVLESMGLLLTMDGDVYKITRVKGLRSKKTVDDPNDTSFISIEKPSSKVIDEVDKSMSWVTTISNLSSILPEVPGTSSTASENGHESNEEESNKFNSQSLKLITIFNEIFTANNAKFEDFLRIISFQENVQLQEDSAHNSKFFLNAISKRFRDVEGFAKRQTKENKIKEQEIHKLVGRLATKISMNGFQIGDLVLFLPTRIDRAVEVANESIQPWAAFNIGAPHYFLKVDDEERTKNKEWMVGRVESIEENKVTDENAGDLSSNPFQLSVGVVWYLVEAKEEHF
ncbi:hypothetical protein G9P44_002036 [Scheffersomyces stipitis]|nr:hypothetical protein G9P44_002036 [Scheffersomyces stipitis]